VKGEYRFGPQWTRQGVVFRLWAPAARRVDLICGDSSRSPAPTAMKEMDGGWWHSAPHGTAEAGMPYHFRIDGEQEVPDPASRQQQEDVHGPSVLVAPRDPALLRELPGQARRHPRRWEETVLYEVHVGTATREGTFTALARELDVLVADGITALELMPVADFPGRYNWGYDGVLPFAPDRRYGTVQELCRLVDAAHRAGLTIWLDVVYNHFGPEGNYLHRYVTGGAVLQLFPGEDSLGRRRSITPKPEVRRVLRSRTRCYWLHGIGVPPGRPAPGCGTHAMHGCLRTAAFPGRRCGRGSVSQENQSARPRLRADSAENDRNESRYLLGSPAVRGAGSTTRSGTDDLHPSRSCTCCTPPAMTARILRAITKTIRKRS
jgi:hypothetical protein